MRPLQNCAALVAILFMGSFEEARAASSPHRPNILFCLADDWSWPHSPVYGDRVVQTPNFDRIAREGALFTHAFSAAPSCTPSRASILTGRAPHQLKEGAMLWGFLPREFQVYPDILERAGYTVGHEQKGWGPGDFKEGGWPRNPAGPQSRSFAEFLKKAPVGAPFCFWFGSHDPHRPYERGAGIKSGMNPDLVIVPPFWPDTPEVRSDILDYYWRVQRFDHDVGEILKLLEEKKLLDDTLIVISGDNGWPFPRCKANLYDGGTRQPLAIRWPTRTKAGSVIDSLVSLTDLAPTFLEAAGLPVAKEMTGQSLVPLLEGKNVPVRDTVFVERERHANVRRGDLSYPSRAIRTSEFLYIRNLRPERWPAGDPEMWKAVGPFGDCDAGPTKDFILDHRADPKLEPFFDLCFGLRPAEEFYDVRKDPGQIHNLAAQPAFDASRKKLRQQLDNWMRDTRDPRALNDDDHWDRYPYFGDAKPMPPAAK